MSTKIYEGLRIQITDMAKFIKIFDKRCLDHIETMTLKLMEVVKPELLLESAERAKELRKNLTAKQLLKIPEAEQHFRFVEVAKLYAKALKAQWNFGNPDCWFNAFIYGKYFYIIPGYPTGLRSPKYPKYVEEFGYWNNTDPPSGMSYKEFEKRGRLWAKSGALDIPFSNRLTHDLISKDDRGSSLILIERRVLGDDSKKINGVRVFPASYVAWLRAEEDERNEHNRSKNSEGGDS